MNLRKFIEELQDLEAHCDADTKIRFVNTSKQEIFVPVIIDEIVATYLRSGLHGRATLDIEIRYEKEPPWNSSIKIENQNKAA